MGPVGNHWSPFDLSMNQMGQEMGLNMAVFYLRGQEIHVGTRWDLLVTFGGPFEPKNTKNELNWTLHCPKSLLGGLGKVFSQKNFADVK